MRSVTRPILFQLLWLATLLLALKAGGEPYQSQSSVSAWGGGQMSGQVYSGYGSFGSTVGTAAADSGNVSYTLTAQATPGMTPDTAGLKITAADPVVTENGSTTLGAFLEMDDGSLEPLPASEVSWSAVCGPIATMATDGTVVFGTVFEDLSATISASSGTLAGGITIRVSNMNHDDFSTYAGDGLDDAWQVASFGMDNPLAKPDQDPDGDGQNNRFEFISGLSPTDRGASFSVRLLEESLQNGRKLVEYGPVKAGRTYQVLWSSNPAGPDWTPISAPPEPGTSPDTRTVLDAGNTATRRFYKVAVSQP